MVERIFWLIWTLGTTKGTHVWLYKGALESANPQWLLIGYKKEWRKRLAYPSVGILVSLGTKSMESQSVYYIESVLMTYMPPIS